MITTAKILSYDGSRIVCEPLQSIDRELMIKSSDCIEIRLQDGRGITTEQRKKIFALIRDVSEWSGNEPEYLRGFLEFDFRLQNGLEPFSLSTCDVTTARLFINYLIDFCFTWDVPTRDSLFNRTDDIDKYLYSCIEYRKCAICNQPADIHHVKAIGMGRNRETICHLGMEAIALCREHHSECHTTGTVSFLSDHHVYGIQLDKYLITKLNLGKVEK